MLKRIFFRDYRGYGTENNLVLTPIILLYGENSSGKSSLIKLIRLISESANGIHQGCLATNTSAFPELSPKSLQNSNSAKPSIAIGLEFSGENPVIVEYEIITTKTWAEPFQVTIHFENHTLKLISLEGDGRFSLTVDNNQNEEIVTGNLSGLQVNITTTPPEVSELVKRALQAIENHLKHLNHSVTWLSADRGKPKLEYYLAANEMDPIGESAISILIHEKLSGDKHEVVSQVNKWLKKSHDVELDLKPEKNDYTERYIATLTRPNFKPTPLKDSGQGLFQVIPVITAIEKIRSNQSSGQQILLLEHPELHLHSRVHEHVMSKLIDCFTKENSQSSCALVETHSESMLIELQIAILERRLNPDQASILWITEASSGEAKLNQSKFKPDGLPESLDFPIESFMTQARLVEKLLKARQSI